MQYHFGGCVLDTERYELHRDGVLVPLRPKVFQVLAYLLAQHHRVVPKDEVVAHVWPGQTISDETLSTCITAARQAVGDSGERQGMIQTRRGVGFRFVAAVTGHDDRTTVVDAPAPVSPPVPPAALSDQSAAIPAGEHKPVTVLVGTVTLAAPLDAETLHQGRQRLLTAVLERVQRYDGTVHQVLDAGFVALFGAPLAQEDHARRAVLAALDLHQPWQSQETDAALPLSLGLHTGSVIVDRLGTTPQLTYTAVGNTTAVATELARQAPPGTIWLSGATRRLVDGYVHLEAGPPVAIPGYPVPVPAYTVLERGPRRSPLAMQGARPLSPFVGRARELATLQALLAQIEAGTGQVVSLVGDPGMGKTRLVYEVRHSELGAQVTWLEGRCLSYGQATPYLPLLDLLRLTCGITERDPAAAIASKLQRRAQALGMPPEAGTPYLLHLLGSATGADQWAGMPPEAIRARTFAALHAFFRSSSQQGPLLLELEDLHWIDPTSEAYVLELVEQMAGLPLLLLVTFRPGYRPQWMDKSYATQLTLAPLTRADSRRLVQAVLGPQPLPEALLQALIAKAQGNPFFLEESVRTLVETGVLVGTPGAYRLARSLEGMPVPATVQAALAARIDRLPPEEKRLLQTAAVIGTEVPLPLLQAIADLPDEALHRGLAHLQAAEFLYETRLFPEPAYTFKHALTHEVAYTSLLLERRRGLHARLVEAIEALSGERREAQVERLAYHAVRGEVWAKAVTYGQQAGARAYARAAFREWVAASEQALQALAHLPEDGDTRELAIQLRLALGTALSQVGEHGQGLTLLGEAETLVRALDDRARRGWVLAMIAPLLGRTGDLDGAIAASQHALALAVEIGDRALQVRATYRLGQGYEASGDFGRAAELLRQNVEATDRGAHMPSTDIRIRSQAWLARILGTLGAFTEGRHHGEAALRLATQAGRGDLPIVARYCLGTLYLAQGDLEPARQVLEPGLALCRASGDRATVHALASGLGYAAALQGRLAEGRVLLEEAISDRSHTGVRQGAVAVARLSEVCRLTGRSEEAEQYAHQALDLARRLKACGTEAHALHQLGVVQAHADPPEVAQAEAHYRQALALAEELGMRPLVAHCHLGLGRLYHQTDRAELAHASLSAAVALYCAMDMTFYLQQAEAALARVG